MDVLILCKDCGEQFGADRSIETMNQILKLAKSSKSISVQFTECMGVCPIGKFCATRILTNQKKSNEKMSLFPDEIYSILRH